MTIKMIVGLGNPQQQHQQHRHNIGFCLVDAIANLHCAKFKQDTKKFAAIAQVTIADNKVILLKPNTYMNCSGKAISAAMRFYKISADEVIIAHDELDLDPGNIKLKFSGGHGGHNGLRDTITAINSKDFYRLRIGIGHPGDKAKVTNFVLHAPTKSEISLIQDSLLRLLEVLELIITKQIQLAMNKLHTRDHCTIKE